MKIRTKVVFISSAAVLGALLLMSGIIFQIVYNSRENEAYLKAEQKSYMMQKEFHSWMNKAKEIEFGRNMAAYYLKSQQEGYFICVEKNPQIEGGQTEEIFNNTIFSPEELLKLDYSADNSLGEHARFFYEDREYLIFRSTYESDIVLLSLEEITYVKNEMKTLAAVLGASVIVIVTLTILVLSTVLRRVFLPLQQLNISAKQMTEGVYNKRVEVEETDEIGQLGVSFNQMAEAVELHMQQLEESEKRKTLFMGNLTHELKTPMTAISGYAQMLLTMKLDAQQQEEALGYIYSECQRLERLSRKMMRLLELDDEIPILLQEKAAADLFEAVRKSSEILGKEKQITLLFKENGEHFKMDFDLMQDVLLNLIDNSIKASEPGSKIVVSAEGDCLIVEDFGKGIPKEEQEHIFEPFYMVDKSRSRKSGGAGLGLALTALIARLHQIEIHIESEVGKGTKIILQFVYNTMNTR